MKKAIMFLLSLSLVVMAQKPKVAVGAVGDEPKNFKALNGLSTKLTEAIVNSGKYTAVDRSDDILKQLGKEHVYQRSGRVDDEQIKELGKQFSVQYLCIVRSSELKAGEYQLSARLVDVETAEITSMGSELSNLKDTKELMRVAEVLVTKLLGSSSVSPAQEKTALPPPIKGGVTPAQEKTAPPPPVKGSVTPTQEKTTPPPVQGSVSGSVLTDARDSKKYKIVRIGSQTWMAENLNYEASGSKCHGNNSGNCAKFGRLYNWNTARSACPSGWHLPSKSEYGILDEAVGGEDVAGKKLKAKSGWNSNGNGTDEFGFSALPGGYGYSDGSFGHVGYYGYWWSATERNASNAYDRYMHGSNVNVRSSNNYKSTLYSVRCLQD